MSDEEICKQFFNYVKEHGTPHIPEGKYGFGEVVQFDDLSIKQMREIVSFMRAMQFKDRFPTTYRNTGTNFKDY